MQRSSTKQVICAEESAERLDSWLHARFPEISRSLFQKMIREKYVRLRGQPCICRARIHSGDLIEIEFPAPEPASLEPEAIPLNILMEDDHLLVLNKPAGMVVHPGAGHHQHTLVHAILHHCSGKLSGIGGVERPGIVHRLDKDTSGCLVVAKTDKAHQGLMELFRSHRIEKIYAVLVWGQPRFLSGHIDKPIGRHPIHRHRMSVSEKGRTALTDWKILEKLETVSLVECRIHTGRTHQIRVHMASMGHPILGDEVYGKRRQSFLQTRQMLHAWKLTFEHPIHHTRICCEAPWPNDFLKLIEEARTQLSDKKMPASLKLGKAVFRV